MFGIALLVGVATNVGIVDYRRFPKDPVLSKFRILGCKIDGSASWGVRISALVLSTSISNVLGVTGCGETYCINVFIMENSFLL